MLHDGQLLLGIIQGPIVTYFDNTLYDDTQGLEAQMASQLVELEEQFGIKSGKIERYFAIGLKLMNAI